MRATVKGAFAYPPGGTTLTLEKVEGITRPGDTATFALPGRALDVKVRGAGFMDYDSSGHAHGPPLSGPLPPPLPPH
jgi:hypothetical protein